MAKIVRLHHAQITIPPGQEDRARQFYCGLLGLVELGKPDSLRDRGGFWLHVGDCQVHIGIESNEQTKSRKAHLAYEVDDLDAMRSSLTRVGTSIIEAVPIPCHDRFEIQDPFGNRVEFIQPH